MVKIDNPNGYIEMTNSFFSHLVGHVTQNCFGVTKMVTPNAYQKIKSVVKDRANMDNTNQGVSVKIIDGCLVFDIYISVSYGVNINAIADSIIHKVTYTVEEYTDLKVSKVNVHIEGIN